MESLIQLISIISHDLVERVTCIQAIVCAYERCIWLKVKYKHQKMTDQFKAHPCLPNYEQPNE